MADLDEIWGLAPQQSGQQAFQASKDAGWTNAFLDFGKKSLFGLFDILDRPGRSLRHLLTGNFSQALEAFDPGFTETESQPISGRDVLQQWGILGANREGLDAGDVFGFGAEVLLDPLTWAGGAIGKWTAGKSARLAKGATRFSEGLAGQTMGRQASGALGRLGGQARGLLEGAGSIPQVSGAVLGAGAGALSAEEGEGLGGAIVGGALGGLAGLGVRHAGKVAETGLALGDVFSDAFRIGRTEGMEGFKAFDAVRRRNAAIKQSIQATGARQGQRINALIEEGVKESGGRYTSEKLLQELYDIGELPSAREVIKLRSEGRTLEDILGQPAKFAQAAEENVGRQMGLVEDLGDFANVKGPGNRFAQIRDDLSGAAEDLRKDPTRIGQQQPLIPDTGILPREHYLGKQVAPGAPSTNLLRETDPGKAGFLTERHIREVDARINALPPSARQAFTEFFAGTPLTKGKIARTDELVEWGILDRNRLQEMIRRNKADHLEHVANAETVDEAVRGLMAEADKLDDAGRIAAAMTWRDKQKILAEVTGPNKVKARTILGTAADIEREFGLDLIERNFANAAVRDAHRFGEQVFGARMITDIANDPRFAIDITETAGDFAAPFGKAAGKEASTLPRGQKISDNLYIHDGKIYRTIPEGSMPAGFLKGLEGRAISDGVYQELFHPKRGVAKRLLAHDAPAKLLEAWRKLNQTWVGMTIAPFASWVTRNFAGNVWNSWLSGGLGMWNDSRRLQSTMAHLALARAGDPDSLKALESLGEVFVGVGKTKISLRQLAEEALEDGAILDGFSRSTGGAMLTRALSPLDLKTGAVKALKNPTELAKSIFKVDPQQNLFARAGFGVNGVLEDFFRIQHYLAKRAKGMDRSEALESVVKSLGDMRNLSPGDAVLREAMPFWAWTRFNIPRQFRGIVEAPHKVAMIGRLKINLDKDLRADVPDEILPDWLQGQLAVPISRKDGELKFFSFDRWLPLADLAQIDSPKKFAQFLGQSLGPIQKEMLEQSLGEGGFDMYFKRAIEYYPGEQGHLFGFRLSKRSEHILRNLRLLSEPDRLISQKMGLNPVSERMREEIQAMTVGDIALRAGTGIKPRRVQLQDQYQRRLQQYRSEMGKFRSLANRARKDGDAANEANYLRLWQESQSKLRMLREWDPTTHPGVG